jgi:hypothetical protein
VHGKETIHDNDRRERTAKKAAQQWTTRAHNKDLVHVKGSGHCRASPFAVRPPGTHGKAAFVVCFAFVVRHMAFSFVFPFYLISSNTYIYFLISFTY